MCGWEAYGAVCSGTRTYEGEGEAGWGQRGKLNRGAAVTEASSDSMGSPGARMALESCPRLSKGVEPLCPHWPVVGGGLPKEVA